MRRKEFRDRILAFLLGFALGVASAWAPWASAQITPDEHAAISINHYDHTVRVYVEPGEENNILFPCFSGYAWEIYILKQDEEGVWSPDLLEKGKCDAPPSN